MTANPERYLNKLFIFYVIIFAFLFGSVIQNNAEAFTLNVVDQNNNPVNGFRWLLEEDTTNQSTPGVHVSDSLAVNIHRSYAPVAAKGTETGSTAAITVPDSAKPYFISVLPDSGFTMSGTRVPVGASSVTVKVNQLPIPTAQISVFVFNDNHPISNAPDAPVEQGLANFSVVIFDQLGQMSQDAFGNPLGTTYDAAGNVITLGTGEIKTDANGEATIKYIAPGKYGVRAVPPHNQAWYQTSTIEGTPGIDSWVKANEPNRLYEFGPGLYHVFIGFVQPMNTLASLPNPSGNTSTISGQVVAVHSAKPPAIQLYEGNPVPECWIGLNTMAGEGVYAQACNADSTFTINSVPPGTYQLVMWDVPIDYIFGFATVIVPDTGGAVDMGKVTMNAWFGTYEGSVFYDSNENGYRDTGESGIAEQVVNIRFRDGSIYQSQPTDVSGEFSFAQVFPFFKFLVYEVDYARFKPTGATIVVDDGGPLAPGAKNNPQLQPENGNLPYRTELGPVLVEAMTLYADQTNTIDWGKIAYPSGENGGITGVVYFATTRAEDDPRYAAADPWEPGIPRVQVNLYQDTDADGIIDDINGIPGIQLSDVDNYPFGWAEGTAPKGIEDVVSCGDGITFCSGDAYKIASTDSWDDNLPTGCVGPTQYIYSQPIIDCAETLQTWNQARPAVFDGGYAFGSPVGDNVPAGTYIVEAVPPPGYEIVKEEDKNVDFGESYKPSLLLLPPVCVGDSHLVPAELSLFPGVPAFYAGQTRPLCDRKQVTVSDGKNAAADFHLFTEVAKAARGVGLINNDLGITLDPNSPVFTEKSPGSWLPISVQDFAGSEIFRVYSDEWGAYNFLAPSSYTKNIPTPAGVSPNMLRICLNHPGPIPDPGNPGQLITDPYFNPKFSLTCYTLDFWPGKTTYLDTPIIPVSAFAGGIGAVASLDCELPDGTPLISEVTNTSGEGPYAAVADGSVTINIISIGSAEVPNPDCPQFDTTCSATVTRDYGFGTTTGTVKVGGVDLNITSWGNTMISGTVPSGMSTGQLVVTRGDNGKSTVEGIILTIGGSTPTIVTSGQSIQAAIDAAAPGSLIIVRPGTYNENLILWKNLQLQGSGAQSTIINAAVLTPEKMQLWRNDIDSLISTGSVSLIPGEDPNIHIEAAAGVTVIANDLVFSSSPRARIDGFTITSASAGGGIAVNGYAHYLEISNNRIINNAGTYAGGIRVGTPSLLDASCVDANLNPTYCSSFNDNISIHNNHITQNGSVGGFIGGGGIGIYNGSDSYQITNNYICGNFSANKGGGIAHVGLSADGLITNNKILLNESSFGTLTGGEAGGILIKGETAPAGGTGGLTPGSGSVAIMSNLIQGNLAGWGNGGGILASFVNGQDIFASPADDTSWYSVDISNNIVVNNEAGFAAGGIFLEDTAKSQIINNTIANNDSTATGLNAFQAGTTNPSTPQASGVVSRAHSAGLLGIAGFTQTFSNPALVNNIIWHNRSFYYDPASGNLVANATLPYWDLQVIDTALSESLNPQNCILTDVTGYAGSNISANPVFVSPYLNQIYTAVAAQEGGNFISVTFTPLTNIGDYHIRANSPAVDAGTTGTTVDFDGESRPNGAGYDIGADEMYTGTVPIGSVNGIGVFYIGSWYLDVNSNGAWDGTPTDTLFTFDAGITGATPITGDWNGDGISEVGVYKDGSWYIDYNGNGAWDGTPGDRSYWFGYAGAVPVTGDWDGTGTTKIGVYENGSWYLDVNGNGQWDGTPTDGAYWFGYAGVTPVTGDWNGNGTTKIGIYDSGTWYLDLNGTGTWDGTPDDRSYWFGLAGAIPVTGDWDGNGITEIGVHDNATWYIDYNGTGTWDGTPDDRNYWFGLNGSVPVTGKW